MAKQASLFLKEIIPFVPACPDFTAETNVMSAAIKFCEDTQVYQFDMDPISTIANVGGYDLEPPSGTTVDRIFSVVYDGVPLEPVSKRLMAERVPKRTLYTGKPKYYLKDSSSTLILGPIPSDTLTGSLEVCLVLKPSRTTSSLPDELFDDYYEAILRLSLYRLLSMPGKDWSNPQAAKEQYALYRAELQRAEQRARKAEGRSVPIVRYGGL